MDPVCRDWYIQKNTAQVGEYGVKQAPFDVNMPTDRKAPTSAQLFDYGNVWTSGFVVSILFFGEAMMQKLLPPEVLFNRQDIISVQLPSRLCETARSQAH